MNKLTKVLLGAGAFLAMSGGLLALTGRLCGADTGAMGLPYGGAGVSGPVEAASGGGHSPTPSGWLEREHLEPFTRLEVEIGLGDVTVQSGDDFGLWLSWSGGSYDLNYAQEEDGTLRVFSRSRGPVPLGVNGSATVYIPQGAALEKVEIHSGLGNVDIDGLTAEELTVECSLGDLSLRGCILGEGELTDGMGDIDACELTVAKSLDVDASMGGVSLEGDLQGDIEVEAGMGEVTLRLSQGEERYSYKLEAGMGKVYVNGEASRDGASRSGGPHSLEVEDGMGDVWVDFNW